MGIDNTFPICHRNGMARRKVPQPPAEPLIGPLRWTDSAGNDWLYEFDWRVIRGRAVPIGVHLWSKKKSGGEAEGETPLTATTVREFPTGGTLALDRKINARLQKAFAKALSDPRYARERRRRIAAAEQWEESQAGKPGPKKYGAAHFREVAEVYLDALIGGKPTLAVAERFVVSKSTAAKWVARARQIGLLDPTQRGKAQ